MDDIQDIVREIVVAANAVKPVAVAETVAETSFSSV